MIIGNVEYSVWTSEYEGAREAIYQRPGYDDGICPPEVEGYAVRTTGCGCCADTIVVTPENKDEIVLKLLQQISYLNTIVQDIVRGPIDWTEEDPDGEDEE